MESLWQSAPAAAVEFHKKASGRGTHSGSVGAFRFSQLEPILGCGERSFALVSFNADGSLDTSFGSNGVVTTDFAGNQSIYDVVLQADGRIVKE